MTVNELILELTRFPSTLEVTVDGYEAGVSSKFKLEQIRIKRNVNYKWYYGEHEQVWETEPADGEVLNITRDVSET